MAKCPNEFKAVLPKILYYKTSFSISGEKSHVLKSYGVNCDKIGLWFILSRAIQTTWKKVFLNTLKTFLKKTSLSTLYIIFQKKFFCFSEIQNTKKTDRTKTFGSVDFDYQ